MTQVWHVSTNEETWSDGEEFSSREAALAWGREMYPTRLLWTGKKADPKLPDGRSLAEEVIELLSQVAYDQAGEAAEEWPDPSPDERKKLEAALSQVVGDWVRDHCAPSFFTLIEVEKHYTEDPHDQG